MAFVFWDTETTGISTDFDQILQFAAIRTDVDFNETDRLELRCRLHPHVVPAPGALRVTGMTIHRLLDSALPCHYDMIRQIRAKLLEWSPAIFIGYNSLRFDEELLRKALFRTLHSPYLTNTGGNGRADAMALVQAASVLEPGCLQVPTNDKGKSTYKLDRFAPLNGFDDMNAHDALGDVLATIHLAKCVRERAPAIFERFVCFASKPAVAAFLDEEEAVVLTEFYFNRPFHYVVAPFGAEPSNPSAVFALDLRHDLDWVASLPSDQLATWVAKSPKPVRRIKTNAAPAIAKVDEVAPHIIAPLTPDLIAHRAHRLRVDGGLQARLLEAVVASTSAYDDSEHVEEQLYSGGFISKADEAAMERFHEVSWPDRIAIADQLRDPRVRYHAQRLIYELHPELLSPKDRLEIENLMWDRLLMEECPKGKWTSLTAALAETEAMMLDDDPSALEILSGLRGHLLDRIAEGRLRRPGQPKP
jgi:exodeoxyribonuclease-1